MSKNEGVLHVGMYVCMYIYEYVCMCVRISVGINTHIYICMCGVQIRGYCMCVCMYVHVVYVCMCACIYTYRLWVLHVCVYACICIYMCIYIYMCGNAWVWSCDCGSVWDGIRRVMVRVCAMALEVWWCECVQWHRDAGDPCRTHSIDAGHTHTLSLSHTLYRCTWHTHVCVSHTLSPCRTHSTDAGHTHTLSLSHTLYGCRPMWPVCHTLSQSHVHTPSHTHSHSLLQGSFAKETYNLIDPFSLNVTCMAHTLTLTRPHSISHTLTQSPWPVMVWARNKHNNTIECIK